MHIHVHTYTCVHVHIKLSQTAVDTLMMKFTTTIHDQAYNVVAEHIKVQLYIIIGLQFNLFPSFFVFLPLVFMFFTAFFLNKYLFSLWKLHVAS